MLKEEDNQYFYKNDEQQAVDGKSVHAVDSNIQNP